MADAISRADWPRFRELSRVLRVQPIQLELPPEAITLFEETAAFGRRRGVPLRPSVYRPPVPRLSAEAEATEGAPKPDRTLSPQRGFGVAKKVDTAAIKETM